MCRVFSEPNKQLCKIKLGMTWLVLYKGANCGGEIASVHRCLWFWHKCYFSGTNKVSKLKSKWWTPLLILWVITWRWLFLLTKGHSARQEGLSQALSPVSITFTFCLSGLNGVLNSPLLPIPRGYFLWLFPIPHMPRIVPSVKHFKFSYLMLSSIFWKDPDWYVYKCVCIFGTYIVYPNNVNSQVMVTSIN